jgi:membrane fusion protein (multidrug efflux system)
VVARNPPAPATLGRGPSLLTRVALGGAALAALAYGVRLARHAASHVTTDDAFVEARVSLLSARIPGSVQEVLVADNQEVREGDVLVRLDPRDASALVEQARAAVTVAQGQWQAAAVGVPLAGDDVAGQVLQARSALQGEARGELRRARAERARMRDLLRHHIVAQEEFDRADAAYQAAQGRADSLRANLRQTQGRRREVDVRQAEVTTAEGRLAAARARLRDAEQRLEYTTIRAPFAGRITRKSVEVGQTVNAAQPLLQVVSTETVWVIANYKESQLSRVRAGQRAEIAVDMYPGQVWQARVDSIQAGTGARFSLMPVESASGNFVKVVQRVPVKLVIDEVKGRLLFPGLSAVPTIDLESAPAPSDRGGGGRERLSVAGGAGDE